MLSGASKCYEVTQSNAKLIILTIVKYKKSAWKDTSCIVRLLNAFNMLMPLATISLNAKPPIAAFDSN